ncbi:MAG TPA: SDR family oxidoreductase [Phycisphaerales bacterium]|nr:SDR family oxidoreductase [Phycisphaerales bacterium]
MKSLSDRIAVVTGASVGIGRATAEHLASLGASVVINARRAERLEEAARAVRSAGAKVEAVAGDAADESVIAAILDRAKSAFGRDADLIVINAGRGLSGSPLTSDPGQWEEMIRLNLTGAARLLRASAQRLKLMPSPEAGAAGVSGEWLKRPRDIVMISSSVGKNISPFSSMYGSTKFAVTALAEAARRELATSGIRVSAIHPAVVRSEFQQVAGYDTDKFGAFMDSIGPVLEPIDVARTIAFIASQPAHVCVNDVMVRPTRQEYP